MRARTSILILIIFNLTLISFAQTSQDKIKIYHCKSDSILKISLIPENILNTDYDLIVLDFEADSTSYSIEKGFEIHWPAPFIDGRMTLVANRRQIYLRSGHDNPNPNHLYWIQNIDTAIFDKILNSLSDSVFTQLTDPYYKTRYLDYAFDDYFPELEIQYEWTDSLITIHQKDHDLKTYENFKTVLDILNSNLTDSEKVEVPEYEDFVGIKIKRLVVGLFELEDQIQLIKIK